MNNFFKSIVIIFFFVTANSSQARDFKHLSSLSEIGPGWSKTSVNATVFRKNSIVSVAGFQFVAYYDSSANVVIAKRKLGTDLWTLNCTQYKGNVYDAHNSISIMIDGDGYLHLSWDHHNNQLNYCQSTEPYGIEMGEKTIMIGVNEQVVSYPEFYRFSNGDLLFAYRDGGSGNGNLVMNRYNLATKQWTRIQSNLIDGQGQRNAYWQMYIDKHDRIFVSWVWRESPDVASNHDMCYAESEDGGVSWQNSHGKVYQLPINLETAEVVYPIPQRSNLMNQTAMSADDEGNAYIATYYKEQGAKCTQYHVIYQLNGEWKHSSLNNRLTDFNLGGMGSRSVPISRPQIVIDGIGDKRELVLIYRDEAFDNKICMATSFVNSLKWETHTLSDISVGRWEPSFDSELWKAEHKLHIYFQNVGQGQGETTIDMNAQMVGVLQIE